MLPPPIDSMVFNDTCRRRRKIKSIVTCRHHQMVFEGYRYSGGEEADHDGLYAVAKRRKEKTFGISLKPIDIAFIISLRLVKINLILKFSFFVSHSSPFSSSYANNQSPALAKSS